MSARSLLWPVVLATLIAFPAIVLSGGQSAFACSCLYSSTADSIAESDVVFTGSVVSQDGTLDSPIWTFDVDGVVKGDVGPTVVLEGGGIDGVGCGPDYGDLTAPFAVFAIETTLGLSSWACSPTPSTAEFAAELATFDVPVIDPASVGPPAAVMVGPQGPYDLSLVDADGNAIARATVGAHNRAVAHCPGTTRVALSPPPGYDNLNRIVDLATMEVIDELPAEVTGRWSTSDRAACLDGGERVITTDADKASPDDDVEPAVDVNVSNSPESGKTNVTQSFAGTRLAVIHSAGVVLLIPAAAGGAIRSVSADDLTAVAADAPLPAGAVAVDADISPDGRRLAVLTALADGDDTLLVAVFDLDAGVIDPARSQPDDVRFDYAELMPADTEPSGIRWSDDDTWVIESTTEVNPFRPDDRWVVYASSDGTDSSAPIAAGKSRGLVTIEAGLLSSRTGGVELFDRDGASTELYPPPIEPETDILNDLLEFDRITDMPVFAPPTPPNALIEIKPVDPNAPSVTLATTPEAAAATERSNRIRWAAGAVGLILATVIVVSAARSRRQKSNDQRRR